MKLLNNINPNIFREYDLRGIYGTDLFEDTAYTIGKSFGSYILEKGFDVAIVGHDNRSSSPILSDALIAGITETGVDVINIGLVTTPMYYFARKHFKINQGIMITASHNPKEYNGFKIAFNEIGNAYGEQIKDFYKYTTKMNFKDGIGVEQLEDIRLEYIELIKKSLNLGDKPIRVVVDCGNGTGSIIIDDVMKELGITYEPLYCESDPEFPNHHPDPSVSKNLQDLQAKVVELGYDLGIGIDGDADRVGIVDEKGHIIAADLYMLLMYRYLNLKEKKALFDVKCSRTLIDELDRLGYKKTMNRTGNSYANMMMQKGDFAFGGEYSGHIFFRDKFPGFDDGIYAGLRVVELLSNKPLPLSTLLAGINHYYSTEEIKVPVTEENKFKIVEIVKDYCLEQEYKIITIDGVRVEFKDGWVLVRASNTGPNLTVRFEASTMEKLDEYQKEFLTLIEEIKRYL